MADAVVADVARFPLRQSLFPEALLQRRVAARVGVGDRHAPRQVGVEPDLQRTVAASMSWWQWSTRSAVIPGSGIAAWLSRGEAEVRMQLMGTSPSAASICGLYPLQLSLYPLALRFVPVSQAFGSPSAISVAVIPSGGRRSSRVRSFGLSSPFFGRPRFRFGFSSGFGFGAGLSPPDDRRRVPRYVADDRAGIRGAARRPVHPLRQTGLREPGEGAGERRFTGNLRHAGPADRPPQRRVVQQPVDRHHRGRHVPHRLRDEGPSQRPAVGGRVADAPVAVVHVPPALHQVQDGDGFGVPHAQRADLPGEGGRKFPLEPPPGIRYG